MPRAAHSVLERLGAGDLDRFIDGAARRERARRALLQRKAGAATGGVLAAFLAAAGAEAREDLSFAQPDAGISPDDFRTVDAGDILSFAEICATGGEGSIFDHALHAARTLASASFEEGFASRLASRFAAEHDDHRSDAVAAHDAGHGDQQGRQAMSAHSSHSDEAGAFASGHGGHEGGAGAVEAPADHSNAHEGESEESLAFAAALGSVSHSDHAGAAVRENGGRAIEQHTADSHSGGIVDDVANLDLDEALTALLGAQEPTTEAPASVAATAAQNDHLAHASLIVEAPQPEILVILPPEI